MADPFPQPPFELLTPTKSRLLEEPEADQAADREDEGVAQFARRSRRTASRLYGWCKERACSAT